MFADKDKNGRFSIVDLSLNDMFLLKEAIRELEDRYRYLTAGASDVICSPLANDEQKKNMIEAQRGFAERLGKIQSIYRILERTIYD